MPVPQDIVVVVLVILGGAVAMVTAFPVLPFSGNSIWLSGLIYLMLGLIGYVGVRLPPRR